MGVSTDAHLFYGIDLGEDFYVEEDEDGEIVSDTFGWLENKLKDFPVNIGIHCSSDCPIYYLFTAENYAWRGYPLQIDPVELQGGEEEKWNKVLKEAAERINFDDMNDEKIGWWLASYWG